MLGNAYRAQNKLEDALAEYNKALNLWVEHKNIPTHHFRAACGYKIGCVELDLGKPEEAV